MLIGQYNIKLAKHPQYSNGYEALVNIPLINLNLHVRDYIEDPYEAKYLFRNFNEMC